MEKEEIARQGSKGTIGWLRLVGGCALSISIFCSLMLAMLLLMSAVLNAYLAWTMLGYEVIVSKPMAEPTSVVVVTPTSEPVLIPTPTPTVVPDSVSLSTSPASPTSVPTSSSTAAPTNTNTPISTQATLEAQNATPTATATQVAEVDVEDPEAGGTVGGSPMPLAQEASQDVSVPGSEATTYVVQPDDALWLIADREYGSGLLWELIFEANRDILTDPDRIWPDQVLRIPAAP